MKPIETKYHGCKFRSRLEARWAVFFDAMGLKWEYEKEGFELEDGTKYLPDFYLNDLDYWIEIKPILNGFDGEPSKEQYEIMEMFQGVECFEDDEGEYCTQEHIFFYIFGPPGEIPLHSGCFDEHCSYTACNGDMDYWWCECPTCGSVELQYNGRSARNKHDENCPIFLLNKIDRPHPAYGRTDDKVYNVNSERLIMAYERAKSARFEHGESPKTEKIYGSDLIFRDWVLAAIKEIKKDPLKWQEVLLEILITGTTNEQEAVLEAWRRNEKTKISPILAKA